MNRILALDPGVTTGYCLAVHEDPNRVYISYGERKLNHADFYQALTNIDPSVLICETFEFRHGKQLGVDLTPVELIGVIKLWASGVMEIDWQEPSVQGKKSFFSDQKLKDLDIYRRGTNHGRSAAKHFMHWLMFGAGYKMIEGMDPELTLVDEEWLLGAYWEHRSPWQ